MLDSHIRRIKIYILQHKNDQAWKELQANYTFENLAAYTKANTALYRAKYADSVTY